jgi:hypothetical protein
MRAPKSQRVASVRAAQNASKVRGCTHGCRFYIGLLIQCNCGKVPDPRARYPPANLRFSFPPYMFACYCGRVLVMHVLQRRAFGLLCCMTQLLLAFRVMTAAYLRRIRQYAIVMHTQNF